jgi:large subunit ribosomal protein L6e
VVFLKQLPTGLLLVSGPYVLNGCPVTRMNQRYVMATKTKLDIKDVKIPERVNDVYFKKTRTPKSKPAEGEIFEAKKEVCQAPLFNCLLQLFSDNHQRMVKTRP